MTRYRKHSATILILCAACALSACSASWRAQLQRGQAYEQQNRPAAALAVYDTLLPLIPKSQTDVTAQVELRRGECLWQLGRPAEAFAAFQKAVESDGENLNAKLRLAEVLLAGGAMESALEQTSQVLKREPENPDALAIVGSAYAAAGQVELAQQTLSRVMQLDPKRVLAALLLAELYDRQDKVPAARQVLLRAAHANPGNAQPWLAMGRLEEQEGNVEAAELAYRKARATEDSAATNLRLAQFLERGARVNEAAEILRRVDQMPQAGPPALPDFELISGHADRAWPAYAGALSSQVAKAQAAETKTRKNLVKGPENVVAAPEVKPETAQIVARLIEADLASAGPAWSEGLRAPTASDEAVARARAHLDQYRSQLDAGSIAVLQAEIALAQGDLLAAAQRAAGAIAVAARSPAAHYVLGVARYRAGEPALARGQWMAALEADSDYIPAQLAMAELSLEANNFAQAEAQAAEVVRLEPANLQALVLYGRALAAAGKYDAAQSVAERAAALDPLAPEPHLVLGGIALQRRQAAQALLEFEQSVLLRPHSPEAMQGLAAVYRRGRVDRAALLKMEAIADREPRSATLLEIAGRLFAEHGWYRDAQRCLQHALAADPSRTTAAQALTHALAATGDEQQVAGLLARRDAESAALLEAAAAQQRGDWMQAIRNYEFAVRHGERTGVAANNLAWIYAQRGVELDRALSLAKTAHDLAPSSPAVMDTLGMVYMARREYSASVEALEKARRLLAQLAPVDSERRQLQAAIQQHLALAYLRTGEPESAARVAPLAR